MQANETGEMEAACHCGTVRFRVKLTDGFNTARRCTCSYCRMRGAVAVSADVGGITFEVTQSGVGADSRSPRRVGEPKSCPPPRRRGEKRREFIVRFC
jgi:hypothetical protein